MPNSKSIMMEDMSVAFIRALCAVNGYSISVSNHDNDGWDICVDCKGKPAADSIWKSPSVQVQLKSSYSKIRVNGDGSITYSLEVKNYNTLIEEDRMIPQILVVFCMPKEEEQWIEQTSDWLKIKKCAYWISLKGMPKTDNTESISITIPSDQLLTKDSFQDIMVKISRQLPL